MKRRHGTVSNLADKREVPLFDMEMEDVELISTATDLIEHDDMIGNMVPDLGIQPKRSLRTAHQFRAGPRIAAGEERHLVTLRHQLFCQIGTDPFCAAVEAGRLSARGAIWAIFIDKPPSFQPAKADAAKTDGVPIMASVICIPSGRKAVWASSLRSA